MRIFLLVGLLVALWATVALVVLHALDRLPKDQMSDIYSYPAFIAAEPRIGVTSMGYNAS